MYDVEVLPSVVNIPRATWDALAPPDDPLWRWSYFRVMEMSGIGPDGFEYIVFRRDRRIVAILPAFWFNAYRLSLGLNTKLDKMAALLRKLIPGLLDISVYFCGHPMGEGRILKAKDEPLSIGAPVLETVRERAWDRGLRWIIFKDYAEPDASKNFPSLKSSTFCSVPGLPDARLQLSWPSFEDYVRKCTPNARNNIRKRLKKFAKFTSLRIETLDTSEKIFNNMMPLYHRVMARAKLELEYLTPTYFTSLSTVRDIETKFIACFDGEKLIGFVLCLFAGEGAVCLRGGFDYQMSHESGCYFVLQYESIKQAISAGCREISFCQTTYRPKLALGCRLAPFRHIVTHKNALVRPIIRWLMPILFNRYSRICGLDFKSAGFEFAAET